MTDASQFAEYDRWIGRKRANLKRELLDCGCPNNGVVYYHLGCDRLSCKKHAQDEHDCGDFAGVRSSTEEKAPEPLEAVSPVPLVQCDTSPWVSFADVAAGPSSGGGNPTTVDVRRRVQDGSAPIPAAHDHIAEALRAEVLRQGLTECEIDGVRWIYGGGQWSESPYQPEPGCPSCHTILNARRAGCADQWHTDNHLDPSAPLVDASSDTAPDVTLMPADQFDELVATLDEPDEVPALRRAWWKRWPW